MRALLALTANDINVHRLIGQTLGLLGLSLLGHLTGDEDLLDDAPSRRGDVVKNNADGHGPAEPHHHERHNDTHDLGLLTLHGLGSLLVKQHRDERQDTKGKVEHDVEPSASPTELKNGIVR